MICVPNDIFKFQYSKSKNHIPLSVKFFENDPDQSPISIDLPEYNGRIKDIFGYNLTTTGQKFIREPQPKELLALQKKHNYNRNDIYRDLFNNKRKHGELLNWIVREWDRRINGFWFYLQGQITYITGKNYFYNRYWTITIGLPDFRDRDVLFFYVWEWVNGEPNCLGMIYMKHRREGATWRAGCLNYEVISRSEQKISGIQSKNDIDAKNVFKKHIVRPWKKLPFYFKPIDNGQTDPQSLMDFTVSGGKKTKLKMTIEYLYSLESQITYMPMSEEAYDGWEVYFYHGDEEGKTKLVDIHSRWNIVKTAVAVGGGKSIHTSTVAEMEKKGGANFKKLWEESDHMQKNENGETSSGLYRVFFPAYLGLEVNKRKFYNEYGISDITVARSYLENVRKHLFDTKAFDTLNEYKRQYPFTVREAFRSGLSKDLFNSEIINSRLEFFTFGNPFLTRGNFEWVDGIKGGYLHKGSNIWVDGRVKFTPNPNGRWYVSWLFDDPNKSNLKRRKGDLILPVNEHRFCGGSDPFKFDKTQGRRKSDGGGAIYMNFDPMIDLAGQEDNWVTDDFIATYLFRPPTKDEFAEDMLMACIYYSCSMNPEISVPDVWEYFVDRGYAGYLYYSLDYRDQIAKNPGSNMLPGFRNRMFNAMGQWIENHGHRTRQDRILEQANEVTPETITDYDLFVAAGLAKVGAESRWQTVWEQLKRESSGDDDSELPLAVYEYSDSDSRQINEI